MAMSKDLTDPNNPLAWLVSEIEGDTEERFGAPDLKTMTTRIERTEACRVDAIATLAGASRANVLSQLILIGLDSVIASLSPDSVRKYGQALIKEYEKEFPSAWAKVEALGADDESVSNREVEVHDAIEANNLANAFYEQEKLQGN